MTEPAHQSRDNPLLVRLRRLAQDGGAYRRVGQVWLEGDHLCAALARARRPGGAGPDHRGSLADPHAACAGRPRGATRWCCRQRCLPASARWSHPPASALCWTCRGAGLLPGLRHLVLDRVQDAGNVGSMLRSASAFGFGQVLALKGTAALWSPKVLRAGMGAHFGLRLVEGLDEEALAGLQCRWWPPVHTPGPAAASRLADALRLGAGARRAGRGQPRCWRAARCRCASRSPAAKSR
jgi:TrmH family RNA methyltransferase